MGAWGTGLYQDDTAMEVRDYYQELLKKEGTYRRFIEARERAEGWQMMTHDGAVRKGRSYPAENPQ